MDTASPDASKHYLAKTLSSSASWWGVVTLRRSLKSSTMSARPSLRETLGFHPYCLVTCSQAWSAIINRQCQTLKYHWGLHSTIFVIRLLTKAKQAVATNWKVLLQDRSPIEGNQAHPAASFRNHYLGDIRLPSGGVVRGILLVDYLCLWVDNLFYKVRKLQHCEFSGVSQIERSSLWTVHYCDKACMPKSRLDILMQNLGLLFDILRQPYIESMIWSLMRINYLGIIFYPAESSQFPLWEKREMQSWTRCPVEVNFLLQADRWLLPHYSEMYGISLSFPSHELLLHLSLW